MRITALNQTHNLKQNNVQSFKGLWGRTTVTNDQEPAMCIFKNLETTYYYPFSDETEDDIAEVISHNTYAFIDETIPQYKVKECKVCTSLPFTQSTYEKYAASGQYTPITENLRKIHTFVHDKYITNELNQQQSASNKALASRLNVKV